MYSWEDQYHYEAASKLVSEQHNAKLNQQGGIYVHGKSYDLINKLEVTSRYIAAQQANGGDCPSISANQKSCGVSGDLSRRSRQSLKAWQSS